MYRKYSGLTKSTRNERLAQLSEQENVIERKKKEILAKIEAQKKKETEEALQTSESTNTNKKDYPPISKYNSCNREGDTKDEEKKMQTPRNAFSNDGSFLDQFKKLSRSGLGSKSISAVADIAKKEEEESSKVKLENVEREETGKLVGNRQLRLENDGHMKDKKDFYNHVADRKLKDFIFENQLPQPEGVHLVSQQVAVAESKQTTEENITKNNLSFSVSALNASVKCAQSERKWQNQESDESSDYARQSVEDERKENMEKQWLNSNKSESQYVNTLSLSKTYPSLQAVDATRISPAFTDEADNSESSENCHPWKRIRPAEVTQGLSTTIFADESNKILCEENNKCITTGNSLNLEDLRNITSLPKTDDKNTDSKDSERKEKRRNSECDSSDSDANSKDSFYLNSKTSHNMNQLEKDKNGDGYQADCEDGSSCNKTVDQRHKKISFHKVSSEDLSASNEIPGESKSNENSEAGDLLASGERRKRRKKSRWGDEVTPAGASNAATNLGIQKSITIPPVACAPLGKTPMLSKLTRSDPGLIQYAKQTFGSTNLSEEDWKKAEDHYKINLLYQDMVKKRAEIDRLEKAGKFKYEYDSDEDVEGGTWEHKLRQQEMLATQLWAEELTRQAAGKHHIGDFLPPEELERFMERYNAVKQGRKPDLSDYKEFKLKEDNVGYRLLQKMGWNEGQGLGQDGSGITNPVNKASTRHENQGLGVERPDGLEAGDDEYDAYRKRMMLAYRFRPNPLNNPRRPYY